MLNNIQKMYISTFLSNLTFFGPIAVPFFLDWGHLDYARIFILESIYMLSIFVFEVPTGVIADKYGKKVSFAAGLFLIALSILGLISYPDFIVFVLAEVIGGCGTALVSGADSALIFDTLKKTKDEKKAKEIFATRSLFGNMALIVSFPIGSFIAAQKFTPYPNILIYPFAISAVAIILAGGVAMFIKEPKKEQTHDKFFEIGKKGLQEIYNNKVLIRLGLDMTMISVTSFFMFWFYQSILRNAGVDISLWGWVAAGFNLFAMLLLWKLTAIEKHIGTEQLLFYSALAIGIFYLAIAASSILWIAIVSIFAITSMRLMRRPLFEHYINFHIRSKRRATVLSTINMMERLGAAILYPVIGFVADVSLQLAFLVLGIATVIFAILLRSDGKAFEKGK